MYVSSLFLTIGINFYLRKRFDFYKKRSKFIKAYFCWFTFGMLICINYNIAKYFEWKIRLYKFTKNKYFDNFHNYKKHEWTFYNKAFDKIYSENN